jgi:competence protein ComEC
MTRAIRAAFVVVLASAAVFAQAARTTLDIYLIDVEGGNATLFVAPSGESLLIDTGNGGAAADRDGGRILAAAKDAGITRIDHLITTHWHGDHFGAMEVVASKLPIKQYIDHGASVEAPAPANAFVREGYPALYGKAVHTVAKPGDTVTIAGLEWRIRVAHLGDLTWNKEFELMCPNNPIGTVDLFVVSHHGQAISNSPQLVHALHPRVMILNNGTRKGGQPDAMKVLHSSPGLEDLWQLHFSQLSGQEYTVPGMFIANTVDEPQPGMPIAPIAAPAPGPGAAPPPAHNGQAYWLKVSANRDGSFTVTNARNGFTKNYRVR